MPPKCGLEGLRPCTVVEHIPSCLGGLREDMVDKKCVTKIACGALNQRACQLTERIPSCDKGLRETANAHGARTTCIKIKPGESPFLATFGDFNKALAKEAGAFCIKTLSQIPALPMPGIKLKTSKAAKYLMIGFTCAASRELDQISHFTDIAPKAAAESVKAPCTNVKDANPAAQWLGRSSCGLGMALGGRAALTMACMANVMIHTKVSGSGAKGSVKERYLALGKTGYAITMAANGLRKGFAKFLDGKKKKKLNKKLGITPDAKSMLNRWIDNPKSFLADFKKSPEYKKSRAARFANWKSQGKKNADLRKLENAHLKKVDADFNKLLKLHRKESFLTKIQGINDKAKLTNLKFDIKDQKTLKKIEDGETDLPACDVIYGKKGGFGQAETQFPQISEAGSRYSKIARSGGQLRGYWRPADASLV